MYDVIALGELLVDFTPCGTSGQGLPVYQANPGGAPCNVLSMLAKLGRRTAFIGKVGHDMFGKMLRNTLREAGIDDSGLVSSREVNTTLAFVQIDEQGDRDFSFYRNPGADMKLTSGEVDMALVENTRIFHFGTLSMTHDDVRRATRHAVSRAQEKGSLVSFDPNLRPPLWPSLELAREQMLYGCGVCSVMKIEKEELRFLTGCASMEEGLDALKKEFGNLRLILVTGGQGRKLGQLWKYSCTPAYFSERQDHRYDRGRRRLLWLLLRLDSENGAGKPDGTAACGHAPILQCRRLHCHDAQGSHPFHACPGRNRRADGRRYLKFP